jgi:hypothetical protein
MLRATSETDARVGVAIPRPCASVVIDELDEVGGKEARQRADALQLAGVPERLLRVASSAGGVSLVGISRRAHMRHTPTDRQRRLGNHDEHGACSDALNRLGRELLGLGLLPTRIHHMYPGKR